MHHDQWIVVEGPLDEIANAIRLLLKDVPGIFVTVSKDRKAVVIDGGWFTEEDGNRVRAVAAHKDYKDFVLLLARKEPLPSPTEVIEDHFGIKAPVIGQTIALHGAVYNSEERDAIVTWVTNVLGKTWQVDASGLRVDQSTIEIDVRFAQVNKDKLREVGGDLLQRMPWKLIFEASIGRRQPTSIDLSATAGLDADLRLLQSKGAASVHDAGHVSAMNEQKTPAEFHHGGVFNRQIVTQDRIDIKEIKFGVFLKARPVRLTKETVRVELAYEFTTPTDARGEKLFTTRGETVAVVNLGDAVVLAGLSETLQDKTTAGVPILREIPFFNLLFKRDGTVNRETSVLVWMSPRLAVAEINPEPPLSERHKSLLNPPAEKPEN